MKIEQGQHRTMSSFSESLEQTAAVGPAAAFVQAQGQAPPPATADLADAFEQSEVDSFGFARRMPDPAGFYGDRAGPAVPAYLFRSGAGAVQAGTERKPMLGPRAGEALADIKGRGFLDGSYAVQRLAALPRDEQLQVLEQLPNAALRSMARAASREGVGSDDVITALNLERACRTEWGKDNPDVADHLRDMFRDGKIAVDRPADPKDKIDGWALTRKDGTIVLNPAALRAPEAMSATLAHEGLHAYRAANGETMPTLQEETDAHLAEAQVFGQLGGPETFPSPLGGKEAAAFDASVRESAEAFGDPPDPAKAKAHVAAQYMTGYAKWATEAGEKVGGKDTISRKLQGMARDLGNDAAAVQALSYTQVMDTALAVANAPGLSAADKQAALTGVLRNLEPQEQAMALRWLSSHKHDALASAVARQLRDD
ncbi:MAG: hypothetical protein HYV63_18480 [Candidatus Schekmanbacteria bacterium]|nr:hypothetical protein [Candidatus Schekmanbacteria bacterium]